MQMQISDTPSVVPPPTLDKLPKPSSKKSGGAALTLVVIMALHLVGGAAFWLTRDEKTRETLREQAATIVDGVTQGTPLAPLGAALRGSSPLPPVGQSQRNGTTPPSGASGRVVQGAVAAPLDRSLPPEHNPSSSSPPPVVVAASTLPSVPAQPVQPVPPRVTADTTVRPDFIDDLALYIVSRYKPGQNSGSLVLSVQGVNQHYGVKMTGLVGGGQGSRAGVLRYVFSPAMIQALYGLYVDRFLDALQQRSAEKSFTQEQTRQLFMAIAGRSVMLAGGLEGVAALPDLAGRIKKLEQTSHNAVGVNAEMMQVVFELDQLRENKAAQARIDEAQGRVNNLGIRYRQVLDERDAAQRTLIADIRKIGSQSLDDDTLLFLAHWVERRLHDTQQSLASVESAAGVLRDLARRCAQTGTTSAATGAYPSVRQP